jgi:ribosomal protein S27E
METENTNTASAEDVAAKAAEKADKAMAKRKEDIAKKHPHAIVESLDFDAAAGNGGKYKTRIRCTECGNEERWVYTSDHHQVTTCTKCSEIAAKAKKAAKRAELKAARELLKAKGETVAA